MHRWFSTFNNKEQYYVEYRSRIAIVVCATISKPRVSYLGVSGEMGSLGLGDLRCVYHPTVRADGRAVRNRRCIDRRCINGQISVAERVPGSLVSLGGEMCRFRLRYFRRVQDFSVWSERYTDVIS